MGTGRIHIVNTIVALNTATIDAPEIFHAAVAFDDLGHNLFFSACGSALAGQGAAGINGESMGVFNTEGDIIDVDPLLRASPTTAARRRPMPCCWAAWRSTTAVTTR